MKEKKDAECKCTGPWDCECQDVLDAFDGVEEQYQEWLEYGKKQLAYSIEGSLNKDIKDVSRYVFDKLRKEYQLVKFG